MKNFAVILTGVMSAVLTVSIAIFLGKNHAIDFLAVILAGITGVYFGYALQDGRSREIVIETVFGCLMILTILAGLWSSPLFLGLGYMAHGSWDVVHRPNLVKTAVPQWYIPLCSSYDLVVGVFILLW